MIYLDSAATTMQKPQSVARAAAMAMGTMASPGRGGHRPGMLAAEAMFRCRQLAAELFHVSDPEHVILTYNATHGLNIAIHSLVGPGGTAVISGYEHNAVTRPLAAIPNGKVMWRPHRYSIGTGCWTHLIVPHLRERMWSSAIMSPMYLGLFSLWRKSPLCASAGAFPSCWTPPNRRELFR